MTDTPDSNDAPEAVVTPEKAPSLSFDFNRVRLVGVKVFSEGPLDEQLQWAALNELSLLVNQAVQGNPALIPVNIMEAQGAVDLVSGALNARIEPMPNGQKGIFVTLYESTAEDRAAIAGIREKIQEQQTQEMLRQAAAAVAGMKPAP